MLSKLFLTFVLSLAIVSQAFATYLPVANKSLVLDGVTFNQRTSWIELQCAATTNHNCTFRKFADTAAYTPSSTNKFCMIGYKLQSDSSSASSQGYLAQTDNSIAIDDNTATTGNVYVNSTTTNIIGQVRATGVSAYGEHILYFEVANTKYLTYVNNSANTVQVRVFGYEAASCTYP